ncbi:protein slit-like [Oratosquilla oratoria]|uniref:protein slit-like n=1 Tax=Oratosquilla oratoria TaxID=337810 RepID=UPI003F772912
MKSHVFNQNKIFKGQPWSLKESEVLKQRFRFRGTSAKEVLQSHPRPKEAVTSTPMSGFEPALLLIVLTPKPMLFKGIFDADRLIPCYVTPGTFGYWLMAQAPSTMFGTSRRIIALVGCGSVDGRSTRNGPRRHIAQPAKLTCNNTGPYAHGYERGKMSLRSSVIYVLIVFLLHSVVLELNQITWRQSEKTTSHTTRIKFRVWKPKEDLRRTWKVLQLDENRIHTLERGAFQDLVSLERLRLNQNRLQHLPDNLFVHCPNLYKLDVSHNSLKIIGKKLLKGLAQLRYLQLDDNQISCVDENAFRGLPNIEILTITNNNITTLWQGTFEATPRLRALRVSNNKLICDCHLAWLGRWLAAAPHLAPYVRCSSPYRLKDRLIIDLLDEEFKCTGLVEGVERSCSLAPVCPHACRCGGGVVDCRDTGQTHVPTHIPDDTIELRLEHNEIRRVAANAFSPYKLLKRIDLSNNEISELDEDAFAGLSNLNSLVLYGNKITSISDRVFRGLSSLQLLLLNANHIQCVHRNALADLTNLNLLSLYDNQIMTLSNGTFTPLRSIQTMHLGANAFVCDCNMAWLPAYLSANPVETSGARCQEPRKLSRRPFKRLKPKYFRCTSDLRLRYAGRCKEEGSCPLNCHCDGSRVDCSGRGITTLPREFPPTTTYLDLSYNELTSLDAAAASWKLPHLKGIDLSHNRFSSLPSGFLTHSRGLTSVNLAGNHISCLSRNSLSNFLHLENLNLSDNPLVCDCRSEWLLSWLQEHPGTQEATPPVCHLPLHFRDVPLTQVPPKELACRTGMSSDASCEGAVYCPPECQCKKTVVRCSRGKLTYIPKGIPPDTTELYLDVNEIKHIDNDRLKHLKKLNRLDLSNNMITILPNKTFAGLDDLSTLIVSYNKLGCVQRDALAGLHALRILSLHGNDVSFIPSGTFRNLKTITHIALGANPLYCDCSMAWLSQWVKGDYVEPGIARCADPRPMRDKLVLTTPPEHFVCSGKVPDEVLAKCDLCYTHPCQNGATCRSVPGSRDFECVCSAGHHGPLCQYHIDACYGHPCDNGGTCKVFEAGRYACHCPEGFEGLRCEVNKDDCAENKCTNSATCVDGINSYVCACAPGYTGTYCEKKIAFCSKEFNPCKNGAECHDEGTGYSCQCLEGWTGANCTENINDCVSHMCMNGGQCVDGVATYECKCVGDWSGRYCEQGPSVLLQTQPCTQHDCKHGVCVVSPNDRAQYMCKCSPGYSGKYCEHQTAVTFLDASSYVQLGTPTTKPHLNLTLRFTTKQQDGALVYHGQERCHIAVEVFKGRLRISYDVGNHPASTMFSYELVSDGEEHMVELFSERQNFTLRVDGGMARSILNAGEKKFLEITTPVFLGGAPPDVAAYAHSQWHLRNATSFRGCMREVVVNGKLQDLSVDTKQNKVVPGCGDSEQRDQSLPSGKSKRTKGMRDRRGRGNRGKTERPSKSSSTTAAALVPVPAVVSTTEDDVCANHKCQKGQCRPRKKKGDYRCKCKSGWMGKFCDKELQ